MSQDTIVWIEDNADVMYPVVKPLEATGYRIVVMRTPAEVEERLAEVLNARVIILDLILPPGRVEFAREIEFPGIVLLRKLRTNPKFEVPVVVLSVDEVKKTHDKLIALGVHSVLLKPVLPLELKSAVMNALGQQDPRQPYAPS